MLIYRVKNIKDYELHRIKQQSVLKPRAQKLTELEAANRDKSFFVNGFSITAEERVKFLVDWHYSYESRVNWRERLICPVTNLNNRQRACYHLFCTELQPYRDDVVFITEQVTPLYLFLKTKVANLIGSEYVGDNIQSGHITETGIRHEDLTSLSFDNDALDKLITFDCLEHISNYKSALAECFRVLKPGGALMASFPFNKNQYATLVRAEVLADGSISHLCEPEYHGNPLSDQGCLSYYTFGWDVLDLLRSIGFSDVYALLCWSDVFGYLGDEQITFIAKK